MKLIEDFESLSIWLVGKGFRSNYKENIGDKLIYSMNGINVESKKLYHTNKHLSSRVFIEYRGLTISSHWFNSGDNGKLQKNMRLVRKHIQAISGANALVKILNNKPKF